MTTDLLVIGAGWSGLLAAYTAAKAGLQVQVVAKGLGSMHWAAGTVDVMGYTSEEMSRPVQQPLEAIQALTATHPDHPYALLGAHQVQTALDTFKSLAAELGLPYSGAATAGDNLLLPSAVGALRPTYPGAAGATGRRRQPAGADADRRLPRLARLLPGADRREPEPSKVLQARAAFLPLSLLTDQSDRNNVHLAEGLDDKARRAKLGSELKRSSPAGRAHRPAGDSRPGRPRRGLRRSASRSRRAALRDPHPAAQRAGHAALQGPARQAVADGRAHRRGHGGHRRQHDPGGQRRGRPRAVGRDRHHQPAAEESGEKLSAGHGRHPGRRLRQRPHRPPLGDRLRPAADHPPEALRVVPAGVHEPGWPSGLQRRRGGRPAHAARGRGRQGRLCQPVGGWRRAGQRRPHSAAQPGGHRHRHAAWRPPRPSCASWRSSWRNPLCQCIRHPGNRSGRRSTSASSATSAPATARWPR